MEEHRRKPETVVRSHDTRKVLATDHRAVRFLETTSKANPNMSGCDRRYEQDEVINLLYQNLTDFDCCANCADKMRASGTSDDNHCFNGRLRERPKRPLC